MKTAIMQPYFLPYIGYWQLLNTVDQFVVYDNIEYTKKGWFNRNRFIENDHDRLFTIPLKKDSDYLPVHKRSRSDSSDKEIAHILRIIEQNYKKAPYFDSTFPIIKDCFLSSETNLFKYIHNSIQTVANYLGIDTKIIISSNVAIDHGLKAEKKVLAICKALKTETYINSIGGVELYDKARFAAHNLDLRFLKANLRAYPQFKEPFVPGLSIIDVLMFNKRTRVKAMLDEYELL